MKKELIKIVKVIGITILTILLFIIGQFVGDFLISFIKYSKYCNNNDIVIFACDYGYFIGIWLVFVIYCLIFKKNRKYFYYLGKNAKGINFKTIVTLGIPFGIGINLLCAVIAMIKGDIILSYYTFNPLMVIGFFILVFIQSSAEEVAFRWFLYQKIKDLTPNFLLLPVLINAIIFGIMHVANSGATFLGISNIVVIAVLFSLIIYYFDSFWAVSIAHAGWNFCQNILLGLPNSGIVSKYSVFKLDAANARDSFAYNVNYGVESTLTATLIVIICCVIVVYIGRKNKGHILNV